MATDKQRKRQMAIDSLIKLIDSLVATLDIDKDDLLKMQLGRAEDIPPTVEALAFKLTTYQQAECAYQSYVKLHNCLLKAMEESIND